MFIMKAGLISSFRTMVLSGAAALSAHAAWANNDKFSLASGLDYSTGKYGTASTTSILSIPVVGKYETGPWAFKLTVPYVRISGVGGVVPGMGRIKTGGATSKTQSGMGDTVATATYSLYEGSASSPGIDVTGKIKFATADTNLGSGANDYAAQIDAYQSMDKFTAMGSFGTKMLGSPAGITLSSVLYGSFGGVYQFTSQASGGLDMSLAQRASTSTEGQQELTAYVSYKIDRHLKAQGYVLKGYSSGSPEHGFGALFTYGF